MRPVDQTLDPAPEFASHTPRVSSCRSTSVRGFEPRDSAEPSNYFGVRRRVFHIHVYTLRHLL